MNETTSMIMKVLAQVIALTSRDKWGKHFDFHPLSIHSHQNVTKGQRSKIHSSGYSVLTFANYTPVMRNDMLICIIIINGYAGLLFEPDHVSVS
jgi:hypothetical protein